MCEEIKSETQEFWKNLFKFIEKCHCSKNEYLRRKLLREISRSSGIDYFLELNGTDECCNAVGGNEPANTSDNPITTYEDNFKNSNLDHLYEKLDKANLYPCLFDEEMYRWLPSMPQKQNAVNGKKSKSSMSSDDDLDSSMVEKSPKRFKPNLTPQHQPDQPAEEKMIEQETLLEMPQNVDHLPLNSPLRFNRSDPQSFINVNPIITTYRASYDNNIARHQQDDGTLNKLIDYYIKHNIFRNVGFARIYDFLFFSNGDLRRSFYINNNGFNINHDQYMEVLPYFENFHSRYDQWKYLMTFEPKHAPFQLYWCLIGFELGDPEYKLPIPPRLRVSSEFQKMCFVQAAVHLARIKYHRTMQGRRCSFRLKRAILYLLFNIILYMNRNVFSQY